LIPDVKRNQLTGCRFSNLQPVRKNEKSVIGKFYHFVLCIYVLIFLLTLTDRKDKHSRTTAAIPAV